jgi:polyisoprenoid-binding protein YceI
MSRHKAIASGFFSIVAFSACALIAEQPARAEPAQPPTTAPATAPRENSGPASPVAPSPTAEAPAGAWNLELAASQIQFFVKARLVNVRGNFRRFEVRDFAMQGDDLTSMRGRILVRTASVFTRDRRRDEHLQQDDFFWSERFPDAVVTVKNIVARPDGKYDVTFTLRIRDKEQELVAPASIVRAGDRITASGVLTVNRQFYDLKGELAANLIMDDNAELNFKIVLKKG